MTTGAQGGTITTEFPAYRCIECGADHANLEQAYQHTKEFHPETITIRSATPEQMKAGLAAMDRLRRATAK